MRSNLEDTTGSSPRRRGDAERKKESHQEASRAPAMVGSVTFPVFSTSLTGGLRVTSGLFDGTNPILAADGASAVGSDDADGTKPISGEGGSGSMGCWAGSGTAG